MISRPELQTVRNNQGQIVIIEGLLPDGTFGMMADEARPFTDEELTDVAKFKAHAADLAARVDASMPSSVHPTAKGSPT